MNPPVAKIQKSRTHIFVQIGIIILGLIGGYIYYSNVIVPNKVLVKLPDIVANDSLGKFKDLKTFNFEIFNNVTFKSLKILGDIPVQPGETGRTDLFAPF